MLYSSMLIRVNESFIKQLIMHFAGTGSEAGTVFIKVKSFNIHLLTVNECYMLSRLIKCAHVEWVICFVPHIRSFKGFYFVGNKKNWSSAYEVADGLMPVLDKVFDERLENVSDSSAPQTRSVKNNNWETRQNAQAQKTWIRGRGLNWSRTLLVSLRM